MLGLDIAYICTKFDLTSISRSRDVVGTHQTLYGLRDLATSFSRMVSRASTCTINLPTKFEVSISTRCENMKGDTKRQKSGVLGWLWSLKVTENSKIRNLIERILVLISVP